MFGRQVVQVRPHLLVSELGVDLLTFYRFMVQGVFDDQGLSICVCQRLSIGVSVRVCGCTRFFRKW